MTRRSGFGLTALLLVGILVGGRLAWRPTLGKSSTIVKHPPTQSAKPNHLIHEKSPYLLQHAYNPVDWFPWGKEAFDKARKENKPIFLSIGYSTCHWCHVMEHESFENPEIAKILNDYFIPIKVDREERPDLDQIYMAATQVMTGSGGWPMSVWLNHDLKPFHAGTYFPPRSLHGRPGFGELLTKIHEVWVQDRKKVDDSGERLTQALQEESGTRAGESPISTRAITDAYKHFQQTYDSMDGGFGGAPKFPRAVQFGFLFRYYIATGDRQALDMALFTLRKMAQGGIYDQLGGGFHRYSVDAEWRVPHFEKMLYDNGQLLSVYTEAWQITRDDFYKQVARDIVRYIARDMTAPGGAFFSAEDADSEGHEGTFYVWTEEELSSLLGPANARVVMAHYDFQTGGNFEHGKNVLHGVHSLQETAKKSGLTEKEAREIIEKSKAKLFEARSRRPRPHLDDKILTAWNGLMISGLARAGRAFGEADDVNRASRAADFILLHLRDPSTGQLLRRYRESEAKGTAFLDDYAFFIAGLLDLFEASQDPRWLREADRLCQEQIQTLWDSKEGGFYFAGADDPHLLFRPKSDYEGAEPAGNSIAALNLLRLAQLTHSETYRQQADQTLQAFAARISRFPSAMPVMLSAFSDSLSPARQIVIAGAAAQPDVQEMLREINQRYLPQSVVLLADADGHQPALAKILPFLSEMKPMGGKATAYICQNYTCRAPITDLPTLKKMLDLK